MSVVMERGFGGGRERQWGIYAWERSRRPRRVRGREREDMFRGENISVFTADAAALQ